jgi:type I restriction enzyme S subunit
MEKGDLVIASSGVPIDADGLLRTRGAFIEHDHLPLCMNTSTIRFKSKEGKTDLRFFRYWLDTNDFRSQITRLVTGSAQKNFGPSHLFKIQFPLPPLNEQRRISAILDQADALRNKRREALVILSSLTQILFTEMFGDLSRPGFDGSLVQLGTQLDFLTSGSRGWAEYYRNSGSLFLRIQNVRQDELDLSDVAFVDPPATAEARRTKVQAGDVLLSITADLGRTAVVPDDIGEAFINQHLSILRSSKLEPRYLSAALSSRAGQAAIQKKNREGVKAGLNFDDIRTLEIPDVDPATQRAFATRAAEIDKLKLHHRAHLAKLDALFASLQHRAFRGEL